MVPEITGENWKRSASSPGLLDGGDKGEAWISYEGSAWRRSDSHVTSDLLSLTHSPLGFVAVGRGPVLLSGNGVNWKTVSQLPDVRYSIAYGNGKFIITGAGRGVYPLCSTNLIDWTPIKQLRGQHVAFGNDRFVMVTATDIQISTNGLDWTITSQRNSSGWARVQFSDGYFLIDNESQVSVASQDGITWHDLPPTPIRARVSRHNGRFFAIAANATIFEASSTFSSLVLDGHPSRLNLRTYYFESTGAQLETSTNLLDWSVVADLHPAAASLTTDTSPAQFFRTRHSE